MSVIKSMKIQVKEAYIKNYFLNGTYELKPILNFSISKSENKYTLFMKMEIENTVDNPFPIDMKVIISGIFEFESDSDDEIDRFMKKDAIQMMYPYLRSYVMNLSASSMLSPIVLPIIDVSRIKIEDGVI